MDLFADTADAPDEHISINQSYAERYQHNKRRVELERLKEKYGNGAADDDEDGSDDDSEDVTEDEDGEQLTPHMDAAILRTLQRIREKKDDLYDTSKRVFDDEQAALATRAFPTTEPKSSSKKMTLRDYQRSRMLEAMKDTSDPAKAFADATSHEPPSQSHAQPTHSEEQEAIRSEFLTAAQDNDDGDGDDLFHVRQVDGHDDKESYRQALLDAVDEEGEKNVRDLLRDHTHDEARTQENEDFLMNYILNRGWVDSDLPQSSSQGAQTRDWDAEAADLDSEASFDSAADAFEHAYNFRFEDPSLAQKAFAIESFPRHTEDTIRRKDDRRKKARAERAERKKAEKETKMRELDQLKALKRQEIADKLKRLRDVSGGDNNMDGGAFEGIDFEADFDPEEHDRLMQQQFNDDYYARGDEKVKPQWDDDIDIDDILAEAEPATKSKKSSKKSKHSDELDMDADYTEGQDVKLSKKERKALKKKEKKAKNKSTSEAAVNEDDMDADKTEAAMTESDRKHRARELMDQYYNLGYEDMIGDTPTRFKYASVPKENYGLSAVEILLADDADLNNVVGLRNLQPYRKNAAKPTNLKKRLKRFREELDAREAEPAEQPKKKRLGRKERQKLKATQEEADSTT